MLQFRVVKHARLPKDQKKPQDLTTMVWACATMDYCCQTFWELCRPRLEAIAQLSPLRPQHLSNTVWSLAAWLAK